MLHASFRLRQRGAFCTRSPPHLSLFLTFRFAGAHRHLPTLCRCLWGRGARSILHIWLLAVFQDYMILWRAGAAGQCRQPRVRHVELGEGGGAKPPQIRRRTTVL